MGCLLEDLLSTVKCNRAVEFVMEAALRALVHDCVATPVAARPTFAEVLRRLHTTAQHLSAERRVRRRRALGGGAAAVVAVAAGVQALRSATTAPRLVAMLGGLHWGWAWRPVAHAAAAVQRRLRRRSPQWRGAAAELTKVPSVRVQPTPLKPRATLGQG
jgi:hypothetical protein